VDYDERSAGLTPSNMMAVDKTSLLLIGSPRALASQVTVVQSLHP
jgi:hypothetical protein